MQLPIDTIKMITGVHPKLMIFGVQIVVIGRKSIKIMKF